MSVKKQDIRRVVIGDVDIPVVELSQISGIHHSTIVGRLNVGWDPLAAALAHSDDQVRAKTSAIWLEHPDIKKRADKLIQQVLKHVKKPLKVSGLTPDEKRR